MMSANSGGTMGLFTGKRPDDLGIKNGQLKPAPKSPNTVSSQAIGGYHQIAPLTYAGDADRAMTLLKATVEAIPRTQVIVSRADYLYVECTSEWMGYVDDVEFYFPPGEKIIHVRSASRLGSSDFGVNRKRIEAIRARFGEKKP
jgi:uncharacterized protein (DUF1499 family)